VLAPASVVFRADRARFPARGIAGGKPGTPSRLVVNPGTAGAKTLPASVRVDLADGDSVLIEPAAGGGYGDPSARDPAALARDFAEGYITKAGAARDYGGTF
jgi:N-methylhydantoinase B